MKASMITILSGWRRSSAVSILLVSLCLLAKGCSNDPRDEYDLRGRVVAVNQDGEQVTLAHEEIPGYMAAMTMPFNVKDSWALSVLAPGQNVEATLVVQGDRSWIEDIRISGSGQTEGSAALSVIPEPGDPVPDFRLLNQDNREIHLHQYQGRPLLITFIYTRCPLPDYCPLTSGKFAAIYHELRSLPRSDSLPHLLTVSFDTEYDRPAVLREYAARYMKPVQFDLWEYATGSEEQIRDITDWFGLVYEKESNQIVHSLVTGLIDPDGNVVRLYLGNQWRPDEVLDDLRMAGEPE